MLNLTKHLNTHLIDFLIESSMIEGYDTDFDDYVDFLNEKPIHNHHVANSCNGMLYVVSQSFNPDRQLTPNDILHLHKLQMVNLNEPGKGSCTPGEFRGEGAIVTIGGRHVPGPFLYPHLMNNWLADWNEKCEDVWKSHAKFEFIHPFLDGNGRVGRLIWAWDMNRRGIEFHRFLDQFKGDNFEQKRQNYYSTLKTYSNTR
jgi:Fic family protein